MALTLADEADLEVAAACRLMEAKAAAPAAPSEHEEQVALFARATDGGGRTLNSAAPFAVPKWRPPPSRRCRGDEGRKAKVGVPDMLLPAMRRSQEGRTWGGPSSNSSASPLELARTPEQTAWIERLCRVGYMAVVGHGGVVEAIGRFRRIYRRHKWQSQAA